MDIRETIRRLVNGVPNDRARLAEERLQRLEQNAREAGLSISSEDDLRARSLNAKTESLHD